MDVASIISSIANMGFPAVLCIIMIWINHEQMESHKTEIRELKATIDNNTAALTEIKIMMYSHHDTNKGD